MELCFDSNNINLFIPHIWYYLKQSLMLIPLCGVCVCVLPSRAFAKPNMDSRG